MKLIKSISGIRGIFNKTLFIDDVIAHAFAFSKIQKQISHINKVIKSYIPNYNARIFPLLEKKILRVTVRVVGQDDYLPTYAGNLDIITSSAVHLAKEIYEKK